MLVSGMGESDGLRKLKCSTNLLDTVSGLVQPKEFPALSCRTDFLTDHSEKMTRLTAAFPDCLVSEHGKQTLA